MKFTASQIAEILDGEIVGDPNAEVSNLAKIEEGVEGTLTFLSNPKYTPYIYETNATIAIVSKDFVPEHPITTTLIKVADAYKAFSELLAFYDEVRGQKVGLEKPHFMSDSASIGADCYIGAFAYIGKNVTIGDKVKIYPHTYVGDNVTIANGSILYSGVKVCSETIIGKNCIIHSNTVLGADGFGFTPNKEGVYNKVPQIGNVIIEDNVEIGACTTIDRATLGSTIIRKGVKLDNQIQIAHNVEIGENTVIAALSGVAGSAKIGKNCMIGGQVGIVGHITIGDNVHIQAQTGVGKRLKDNAVVQGTPAFKYGDFNKSYIHFKNLPKLVNTISQMEKEIKALKER